MTNLSATDAPPRPRAQRMPPRARLLLGSLAAYGYNSWLTRLPSRRMRRLFLARYLGALGAGTSVQLGVRFLHGGKVFLGRRNVINFDTLLDGRRHPIKTGDDVSIGPAAAILTLGHSPRSPDFADEGGPVTIGEGAVVAANAVVTRDVNPFTIVAGSPARPVGARPRDLRYHLEFDPFLG